MLNMCRKKMNGKKETILQFTERARKKTLNIFVQFLDYWFVGKIVKGMFLTKYLTFSPLINSCICINKLLSVTRKVFTSFDNVLEASNLDMRHILDLSKAFDKVRHEGPIFKLKQDDIFLELLHISSAF